MNGEWALNRSSLPIVIVELKKYAEVGFTLIQAYSNIVEEAQSIVPPHPVVASYEKAEIREDNDGYITVYISEEFHPSFFVAESLIDSKEVVIARKVGNVLQLSRIDPGVCLHHFFFIPNTKDEEG